MVSVMTSANCLTAFSRALMIVFKPEKRIKHYYYCHHHPRQAFPFCLRSIYYAFTIIPNLMMKVKGGCLVCLYQNV